MRSALLATVAWLAIGVAYADDEPPSHIKVVGYSPTIRQRIKGILNHPTIITFPTGEEIYRTPQTQHPGTDEGGNSADNPVWSLPTPDEVKATPLLNILPMWPVQEGTVTMTVVTKSAIGGELHAYPFLLSAVPDTPDAQNDKDVVLNLIFKGTAAPPPPARTTLLSASATAAPPPRKARPATAKQRHAEALERIRTEAFNDIDNACHYHAKGKQNALTPRCPMDNGQWTLIRFPGLTQKPSVHIGKCEKGDDNELVARQHGAADFVVVEETAAAFCLRLGDDVLEIVNDDFHPDRITPSDTIAPGVIRIIKTEK
jgi:type IV secretory pathway VirB9-like protein